MRLLCGRNGEYESSWVIKEVLEIINAAELEDVDAWALFCYIERGHDYKLNSKIDKGFYTTHNSLDKYLYYVVKSQLKIFLKRCKL